MNLTVDASVVIKWFVAETLFEQARLLLSDSFDLHAPDILLAEFANTIWKKVRRGEVSDSRPYTAELSALGEIIALHPIHNLVVRSASIAKEIDHPIYDCLYLACAEATDSTLVTADRRFANKVGDAFERVDVRYIGEERFAREFGSVSWSC